MLSTNHQPLTLTAALCYNHLAGWVVGGRAPNGCHSCHCGVSESENLTKNWLAEIIGNFQPAPSNWRQMAPMKQQTYNLFFMQLATLLSEQSWKGRLCCIFLMVTVRPRSLWQLMRSSITETDHLWLPIQSLWTTGLITNNNCFYNIYMKCYYIYRLPWQSNQDQFCQKSSNPTIYGGTE